MNYPGIEPRQRGAVIRQDGRSLCHCLTARSAAALRACGCDRGSGASDRSWLGCERGLRAAVWGSVGRAWLEGRDDRGRASESSDVQRPGSVAVLSQALARGKDSARKGVRNSRREGVGSGPRGASIPDWTGDGVAMGAPRSHRLGATRPTRASRRFSPRLHKGLLPLAEAFVRIRRSPLPQAIKGR